MRTGLGLYERTVKLFFKETYGSVATTASIAAPICAAVKLPPQPLLMMRLMSR